MGATEACNGSCTHGWRAVRRGRCGRNPRVAFNVSVSQPQPLRVSPRDPPYPDLKPSVSHPETLRVSWAASGERVETPCGLPICPRRTVAWGGGGECLPSARVGRRGRKGKGLGVGYARRLLGLLGRRLGRGFPIRAGKANASKQNEERERGIRVPFRRVSVVLSF